jgi:outer membrane protein
MRKAIWLLLCSTGVLTAEVRTMSLREAVQAALQQNPDIALARLDEEKARQAIKVARDPFAPKLGVGSGLAYSYGFPMSIEGSAPSVFQAQASQFIFNRPQNYVVAAAKEDARGATIGVSSKRDEVAYRVAALYLDAERAARVGEFASKDAESLEKVLAAVQAQVREGRALPLAEKTAALQLARARQSAAALDADRETAQTALAVALGLSAEDRVQPATEGERAAPPVPVSEERAVETAIENNKDLRRLESQIASRQLLVKGDKAAWLPRVDLVAQYGLFAKFNNYEDYFRKFQRHNGQIGVSFQLPILSGPSAGAQAAQGQSDVARLKLELSTARNRIVSDLQRSFRDLKTSETSADVARLDLDVAREQLSVNLAQMEEGRITMRQVEESRVVENQKWIAFYDAQYTVEKARWAVLRLTGTLTAAIETLR